MQKWIQTSCLFGSWFSCAQTGIFSAEPCSKNAGETSFVRWITAGEQSIPASRNPNQNRAALWRIFSSNKSAPANRKTGFEQAGGWIHFCMKWLRTLKSFQIFRSEIKKSKTYSGWCPFQGLSMQWYHSHVDPIWQYGSFKSLVVDLPNVLCKNVTYLHVTICVVREPPKVVRKS